MTIALPRPAAAVAEPPETHAGDDYLKHKTTIRSWLLTTDHKRIGVLYFVVTAFALLLGGAFALALRVEHFTPGPTIMRAIDYNRTFTVHGIVMVWLFLIPSIPTVFGNFFLPIMLGAKDVAFPKLNLLSWYLYVAGVVCVLVGLFIGAPDTGWTFYAPFTATTQTAVLPVVTGIFIAGFSTILTGVNFIATTHTMRARGMTWMKVPLFVWALYGTSVIQVLATPVLGVVVALAGIDHWLHWGIFDPAKGGDPVLFQHLFWFYSHPAVYIMILPAMGVVSEVVCTFAHKNPFSYRAIAFSTFGIAFVGFLTWGHHLFVSGMSVYDAGAFGILSMLVAIFSAIKVFTWTWTLKKGAIVLKTPLLYIFGFFFLFVFGGMTGVAVATTSLDVHWHDTYFVVAHFHFIMVGGTLTAWLAALHYWFPKMTGRMYPERLGVISAGLVFGGFFVTFFPQFLLGNAGMPRRYFDYPPEYQWLHVTSTAGALLLGAAMMITLLYLAWACIWGDRAPDNPWESRSYEWRTPTPPPVHNFPAPPRFDHWAYDYTHEVEEEAP